MDAQPLTPTVTYQSTRAQYFPDEHKDSILKTYDLRQMKALLKFAAPQDGGNGGGGGGMRCTS